MSTEAVDHAAAAKADNRRARRNAMTVPNGATVVDCPTCSRKVAERRLADHVRYSHTLGKWAF